jgi:hypothetical protein
MNDPVRVAMTFSLMGLPWLPTSRSFGLAAQRAYFRHLVAFIQAAGPGTLLTDDRKGARTPIICAADESGEIVEKTQR